MRHLDFTPFNASHSRLFRIGGISADTSYYDPGNDTLPPPPVTHPDWNFNITGQHLPRNAAVGRSSLAAVS